MSLDINLTNVESTTNKSTNVNTDQASNTKYPSVKAVFDWANSAISWIATNGANVLSHLSNTNNPHSTTATQVDALKRDGSNANSDVDLDAFGLDAKFIKIKGTGGNGHLNLKHQSSGASAGGGESVIYADSSGNPKWKNDGNAVQNVMLENSAITGATKTKITYDSKGLVTAGADATTADIADSSNKRYVTDAQLTVLGNTSGTNTGDQTLSGLGGVPTTRTITINGTTQDLSANRTFSAINLNGQPNVANSGFSGALRYFGFSDNPVSTTETLRRTIITNDCTLKNFYIRTSGTQPAAGSHVLTVLKNGVATSITITIPAGSSAGKFSDTTNSESFVAGDEISILAVNNASSNSASIVSFAIGNL